MNPAVDHSDRTTTLIVSVNWIGDVIMSMPAVQAYRAAHDSERIVVLAKPSVLPLWERHAAPDRCIPLQAGGAGLRAARRELQAEACARAYILPNSFRSAWLPFRAGMARRIGAPGHWRRGLLTDCVRPAGVSTPRHQVFEYYDLLLGADTVCDWEPPVLSMAGEDLQVMRNRWDALPEPHVVLAPGAARGPSKQWPAEYFIELGRRLVRDDGAGVAVTGAPGEAALCAAVADGIGDGAQHWGGKLSFSEWLAGLAVAHVVVCNDSGTMHVAAALGTPLVALYGRTDPAVTGPLSRRAVVLQKSTRRSRSVARDDPKARAALRAILPEEARQAVHSFL